MVTIILNTLNTHTPCHAHDSRTRGIFESEDTFLNDILNHWRAKQGIYTISLALVVWFVITLIWSEQILPVLLKLCLHWCTFVLDYWCIRGMLLLNALEWARNQRVFQSPRWGWASETYLFNGDISVLLEIPLRRHYDNDTALVHVIYCRGIDGPWQWLTVQYVLCVVGHNSHTIKCSYMFV